MLNIPVKEEGDEWTGKCRSNSHEHHGHHLDHQPSQWKESLKLGHSESPTRASLRPEEQNADI
jgi:hypothetical protein